MTRPAMFTQQRKAGLFLDDGDVRLYHGDALETLRQLPDGCVDMVATSPPFYGLRDYGVDGQIGLEETPDQWVERLVAVFRECRRVLREFLIRGTSTTLGWSPSCACGRDDVTPAVVLDPFGGSGTTAIVARHHGRHAVLIELNEDYCKLAADRLSQLSLLTGASA